MNLEPIRSRITTLTLPDLQQLADDLQQLSREVHELIETISEWQRPAEQSEATPAREAAITYRQQYTKCNKDRCKKCTGEGQGHGPYWYAFWSEEGRTRSKYIGKLAPAKSR